MIEAKVCTNFFSRWSLSIDFFATLRSPYQEMRMDMPSNCRRTLRAILLTCNDIKKI
jgi:hypothetical protein